MTDPDASRRSKTQAEIEHSRKPAAAAGPSARGRAAGETDSGADRADDDGSMNGQGVEMPNEQTLARAGHADADRDRPQPPEQGGVVTGMASAAWQATAGPRAPGNGAAGAGRPGGEAFASSVRSVPLAPVTGELTDAEIMLRVRNGDDAAFTYLIGKYQRPIVHFMFRMVHNQAVAEELTQEVFLRVYRSRASYRAEAKFTTWLYRIATNLGVNHARDNKHERAAQNIYLDQPDAETGTTPDVADSRSTVEQELMHDERMRAIRQHVMALPERQKTAVLMHKFQEMDYKQIGEVLKLSESATKSLLFRAYQTLRESLKEYV